MGFNTSPSCEQGSLCTPVRPHLSQSLSPLAAHTSCRGHPIAQQVGKASSSTHRHSCTLQTSKHRYPNEQSPCSHMCIQPPLHSWIQPYSSNYNIWRAAPNPRSFLVSDLHITLKNCPSFPVSLYSQHPTPRAVSYPYDGHEDSLVLPGYPSTKLLSRSHF